MFEYTKNNHLKITYQPLNVSHGVVSNYNSFRQECKNTALELFDIHKNDLTLLLSGGVDSEIMLLSFISNGIIPNVVILKYQRNLNMHDINYALRLCSKYSISPKIIDVNVEDFFIDNLTEFATITKCSSPQLNLICYYADRIDGIPVLGMGENFLTRIMIDNYYSKEVYDCEQEKEIRLFSYFVNKQRECIPSFFQYTPEMMISFLQKKSIYNWVEKAKSLKYINTNKIKCDVLSEDFDIEPRPKLNGFELLPDIDQFHRSHLETLFTNEVSYTLFEDYVKSFGVNLLRDIKYE